jgi:hypothetical protein
MRTTTLALLLATTLAACGEDPMTLPCDPPDASPEADADPSQPLELPTIGNNGGRSELGVSGTQPLAQLLRPLEPRVLTTTDDLHTEAAFVTPRRRLRAPYTSSSRSPTVAPSDCVSCTPRACATSTGTTT